MAHVIAKTTFKPYSYIYRFINIIKRQIVGVASH